MVETTNEQERAFDHWVHMHNITEPPTAPPKAPTFGGNITLHDEVIKALPVPGTTVKAALAYGMSLWGQAVKIEAVLPSGQRVDYLMKMVSLPAAKVMIGGEFEALKAMHAVSPRFIPQPFAHGEYKQHGKDVYFIIVEFRMVGEQPPDPARFTAELAKLHKQSVSPTGKFGFHTRTCHARIAQKVDLWTNSWCELYKTHLSYMVDQDREHNGPWPEFKLLCDITLEHVIPRLLLPLQSEGRSIKPCLVHGDLWDENTATDMRTGEPFIFDPGAFYAHNEYEIGNWRAVRHRLSKKAYVQGYKSNFPASEPADEWVPRNILYSLRYNLTAAVLFPGSAQRQDVFNDMKTLCEMYFPDLLKERMADLKMQQMTLDSKEMPIEGLGNAGEATGGKKKHDSEDDGSDDDDDDEEEEEEEEEEKGEEWHKGSSLPSYHSQWNVAQGSSVSSL